MLEVHEKDILVEALKESQAMHDTGIVQQPMAQICGSYVTVYVEIKC